MDRRAVDQYYHFVYDPVLYGLSLDYWAELSGAALWTSNIIRLRADIIASKEQYAFGDFIFRLTIPTAPAAGDTRRFGLISPAFGTTKNAMYFEVSGATFSANVVTDGGTSTSSTITWDSNWTATATDFRIHWDRKEVRFYINDVTYALVHNFDLLPRLITLPVYLRNDNLDNVDLTYMQLRNVYQVVAPRWAIPEPAPDTLQDRQIDVSQSITVSEAITMGNVFLNPSINDTVTVSESVTTYIDFNPNVNDAITVAEAVTMEMNDFISVNEPVTVAEDVTMLIDLNESVNEAVSVAENVNLTVVVMEDVNEVVSVAEAVTMLIDLNESVNEAVTVAEAVTIEVV